MTALKYMFLMLLGFGAFIGGLVLYVLLWASLGFCDFPQTVQAIKTPITVQNIQTPVPMPTVQVQQNGNWNITSSTQTPIPVQLNAQQTPVPVKGYDSAISLSQNLIPGSIANSSAALMSGLYGHFRSANKTLTSGSTTTSIKITSHGAVAGQFLQMLDGSASTSWAPIIAAPDANTLTLAWALNAAPASGDHAVILTLVPIGASNGTTNGDKGSALDVAISTGAGNGNGSMSGGAFLLKLEDAVHGDGDAGVAAWGVSQDPTAQVNFCSAASGDYCPLGVNRQGTLFVDLNMNTVSSAARPFSIGKLEDAASNSGDGGVPAYMRYVSAFGVSAGTANDYANIDGDIDGRLAVNPFGAAPAQTLQGCTMTPIANATPVAVFTATTSTRYYVQGVNCNNQNTTATEVQIQDGSTVIDDCWLPSNAVDQANCNHNFTGMPLRGSSATALNVKTTTGGASVVCCVHGYTSAN